MRTKLISVTLGALIILGSGCSSNPDAIRLRMISYSERGMYDEARSIEVKHNPGGIPRTAEENIKEQLIKDVVNPAQVASCVQRMQKQVLKKFEEGQFESAREEIHTFGTVGVPEVDGAVLAMKLAILNSRINPSVWAKVSKRAEKAVNEALVADDFKAAAKAIDQLKTVRAYSTSVDEALQEATLSAIEQNVPALDAMDVLEVAQDHLYFEVASRPDYITDPDFLEAYFTAVASMTDYIYKPDWENVKKNLEVAKNNLVSDDVTPKEAQDFIDYVLSEFVNAFYSSRYRRLPTMTTKNLNDNITNLKKKLTARVSRAIDDRLQEAIRRAEQTLAGRIQELEAAKKAAEEAARIADEKEAAAKLATERALAAAEEAAKEAARIAEEARAAARAARRLAIEKAKLAARIAFEIAQEIARNAEVAMYRKLALENAARIAHEIDLDTRVNAFIDAISDHIEPDINRILGDGARVIRLYRTGAEIEKEDATSLFVAATYMGFDDVMRLALTLGADVNGYSPKDNLARPAILVALQYGPKGDVMEILSSVKAELSVCDSRKQGALHYGVRSANASTLLALLKKGLDAKASDSQGVTPLLLAADLGYSTILQMLAPLSDIEAKDKDGFTALLRAAEDGRTDLVRVLIARGAKIDAQTNKKDGVLELAAAANSPGLLVYLLDEKKIPPTERCTAQLVIAGNVPTLQQMVAHGAKLEDKHLAVAVKLGNLPMVKYLVSRGMDVNADCVKGVLSSAPARGDIKNFLYDQGYRGK